MTQNRRLSRQLSRARSTVRPLIAAGLIAAVTGGVAMAAAAKLSENYRYLYERPRAVAPRRGHSVTLLLGKVTLVDPPSAAAEPVGRHRLVVDPILIFGHVASAAVRPLVFAPDRVTHSARRLVFAPEVVQRSAPPDLPTRAAVREVLAESHDLAERCFDRGMVPGPVTLHLDVRGRDGRVERARAMPSTTTSKCVERAAARMQFPRFARREMHVVHRYVFR